MRGRAFAPGGISCCNAIIAGRGATAAIDLGVEVEVELERGNKGITVETIDYPEVDTSLVERCVGRVLERGDTTMHAWVRTRSTIPPSVGLKTSSAVANGSILATLDALDASDTMDRREMVDLGIEAAREVGVTVTGALDDAMASMFGGLVMTDNLRTTVIDCRDLEEYVAIVIPSEGTISTSVDTEALQRYGEVGDLAFELVRGDDHHLGMTVNGLAVTAALELDPTPTTVGLSHTTGVSVSGTGPAVAGIGPEQPIADLAATWEEFGHVLTTQTRSDGASIA